MNNKYSEDQDNLLVDELLVILQEKRTALAMIRIGIAILMVQMTILSFLIATSKFYVWLEVLHLLALFILLNILLLGLAGYFIFGSVILIHQLDRQLLRYKKSHSRIAGLMD
jgi:hypothetical protein